ncbi:hypothetical protein ACM39_17145 [Chryseobacterium sp. FH2]|uniref:hypothetical protein n=1 Tax=Chryseobacterium sp. FH2 TaxID=1674291 RepID=UPI00065ACD1F|nr:hypothetical protein [Chryseobacterium sp. FH2]KMQ64250.1 hypothetical protein ACM39_17145 [Chryseobacterium sp. FH2]
MLIIGIIALIIIIYLSDKNRHKKEIIDRLDNEKNQLLKSKNSEELRIGEKIVEEFYKLLHANSPRLKVNTHVNEIFRKRTFVSSLQGNKSCYFEIIIKDNNVITIEFDAHTSYNSDDNYHYFTYSENITMTAKKPWVTAIDQMIYEKIIDGNCKTLY